MSVSNKMYSKNSSSLHTHTRNDSQELDVFEAALYFSTTNNNELNHSSQRPAGRMSLDMPMMRHALALNPPHNHPMLLIDQMKDNKKKYKQPSSPGGRLASFLNSLFNQKNLKKKKSKSKDIDDQEETHDPVGIGRRKRRSSISHIKITTSTTKNDDSKSSLYSSSGFRTPPPYINANTPIKSSYKEFMTSFSHKKDSSGNSSSNHHRTTLRDEIYSEKMRFSNSKQTSSSKNVEDADDHGADSDSSSDLFDLPNHDLDFYPTGDLPLYETTHMEPIKINNGTTATA